MVAEHLKPAEQMRITGQLGQGRQVWKLGFKITEKMASGSSIPACRLGSEGSREGLNTSVEDVRKHRMGKSSWSGRAVDLEWLILFNGAGARREVLSKDEPGRHEMVV